MSAECEIFGTIERIRAASYVNIAYMGGSLTAAAGAGDTANSCWRRLFTRYIYECYHAVYHCQPCEVMGAIGAMESYGAVFTMERNVTPFLPVLAFIEFSVNDRGAPDKKLVIKGLEGIIRQLRKCPTRPDVVFVGAGCRQGATGFEGGLVDHSLHKEVAAYYGVPFIDVQSYMHKTLEARGQTWESVSIVFENNDSYHLNNYGNAMWFECIREWFAEQWKRYDLNPTRRPELRMPAPMESDELEFAYLVDPSKRSKNVEMEGTWEKKDKARVPWYLDSLLIGRTGDRMTFRFTGTTIGMICLVHPNGLKVEAKLDGRDIAGPYTNFAIEFGKFAMLEQGLKDEPHVLELIVGEPMSKKNKHPDPTAQIGYFAVASKNRSTKD